ncbi:MAG: hypothetical protein CMN30_24885 [Sandaracinus sp.]|nr:hypothetical protein [Sandaracinus sp.]|tara:strand:+ start:3294 stop:3578 length:285 start_codon:yes stop_codon:yes gene_type:complete
MSLREKLEAEVLPATWAALEPHARRNALFVVAEGTELVDAAVAVASDDQETVGRWIQDTTIRRPTLDEVTAWDEAPVAFYAIIVQPFVLCRPIG